MFFGWTGSPPSRHSARVALILAFFAFWLQGLPAFAGVVTDVRVESDRIVIQFDQGVGDASAFLLGDPRRIAVDVAGAAPGDSVRAAASGPVTQVRQGSPAEGSARIVFDLAQPAIVTEGRFAADGRSLTLMLRTVDDSRFERAAAEGRIRFVPPFSYAETTRRAGPLVRVAVPAPAKAPPLPRIYGDDDSRPLVVIDAGHGGRDPGAIASDGTREKDLTLRTALAIRDALVRSGRVRVALTREDDRYLILQERYGIARRLGADLFISVHCDSAGNPTASGATVYTLSEIASDKEAARLAARENKADILAGIDLRGQATDVSSILIDLTQRETMNASARFARLLGREASGSIPTREHFHRMASFMVLKAPDMPSILFETGYLSNDQDAAFLGSRDGRAKIADTVRRSVEIHFASRLASN